MPDEPASPPPETDAPPVAPPAAESIAESGADADPVPDAEPEWRRRQRLEAVFGDVLPDTTSDERGPAATGDEETAGDRWLRAQVPPHHG